MKKIFCAIALLLLFSPTFSVQASLIFINTADDELNNDGDCSLREAVEAANTNSAVDNCTTGQSVVIDAIFFVVSDDIVLDPALGPLVITDRVNLEGSGRDVTVIRQESNIQLFNVQMTDTSHDVEFKNMTLRDGHAADGVKGGAVQLGEGDQFKFTNVAFIENISVIRDSQYWAGGGAVFAGPLLDSPDPSLVIEDCLFQGNSAIPEAGSTGNGFGGAIHTTYFQQGEVIVNQTLNSLVITDSEFADNSSERSGSAVYAYKVSTVIVEGSQFIGNSLLPGPFAGNGALAVAGGGSELFFLSDSTFVDNIASSATDGSALWVSRSIAAITNTTFTQHIRPPVTFSFTATGTIQYSTIVDNGTGDALDTAINICADCDVSLRASIVWNAWDTDNLCDVAAGGTFNSLGYNIDSDGSCTAHGSDMPSTDPGLVPLDAWGDDIANFDLLTFLPAGPALDAAYLDDCPGPLGGNITSDARGEPKPVDGSETGSNLCDIGAVEYQFEEDPAVSRLTVNLQDSSQGSVSSTNFDNIDCSSDTCTAFYSAFSQVRLVAEPEPGFQFDGWSGACSGTGQCMVNMSLNRSVTATFTSSDFTLEVILDGNGMGSVSSNPAGISCPGQCEAAFDENTMVTLTASPHGGQTFQGWSGDCSGTGTCQVTIDQARTVRATFLNSDTVFSGGFE
ncbi:MAG TPA: CSLREA domain-containing protein [Xanthomonadales bacterium]|nr:CSLREA domain-containing protein [Xanthomonadales bacterium]